MKGKYISNKKILDSLERTKTTGTATTHNFGGKRRGGKETDRGKILVSSQKLRKTLTVCKNRESNIPPKKNSLLEGKESPKSAHSGPGQTNSISSKKRRLRAREGRD